MYEGGVRVPCLVRWPGVTAPGTVCDTPIQVMDWLPTLLAAAAAKPPQNHPLDGQDITPLFKGLPLAPRPIVTYAPLYDLRWAATPAATIRAGDWKLIEFFGDAFDLQGVYRPGHRLELYNLATDIGESKDLAGTERELARKLQNQLHAYLKATGAELPKANPHLDRSQPLKETRVKPAHIK
jgi:arylsulfatase A